MPFKVLCVYDPSVIFLPHELGRYYADSIQTYQSHKTAQLYLKFKVALNESIRQLLYDENQMAAFATFDILQDIVEQLSINPGAFAFIESAVENAFDIGQLRALFQDHIGDFLLNTWYTLIGSCTLAARVCLASWYRHNHQVVPEVHGDLSGLTLYVVHNRYDWVEQYRAVRQSYDRRLPNLFATHSRELMFPFCPGPDFAEEENDIVRGAASRNLVERGLARRESGFRDCRGNIWVWNAGQRHWDVQLSPQLINAIGARDGHLDVQPASEHAPHDNEEEPQGCIRHRLKDLDIERFHQLTCTDPRCPRKT